MLKDIVKVFTPPFAQMNFVESLQRPKFNNQPNRVINKKHVPWLNPPHLF